MESGHARRRLEQVEAVEGRLEHGYQRLVRVRVRVRDRVSVRVRGRDRARARVG